QTSRLTMGYTARDLARLVRETALTALRTPTPADPLDPPSLPPLTLTHWNAALGVVRPSQNVEFDTRVPSRTWADLGGFGTIKKRLQLLLALIREAHPGQMGAEGDPTMAPRTGLGLKPPSGLLLYGPPGCGKTAFAQAIANESKMNTIVVRGPEVFSKYFGDTEAILRRIFATARTIAPCIVWIDEIDTITRKRGNADGSGGIDERVLSTLLNEMDGVQERPGILVVGCTTYPDRIDDAILRPGRFDQLVYLPIPSRDDRDSIIRALARQHPLAPEVDIPQLVDATDQLTPAYLENLFREAAIMALRDNIDAQVIEQHHLNSVLETIWAAFKADDRFQTLLANLVTFRTSRK
ncbi:P-loop containing nucleoside triphosphate hydrolase protein, partial [Dimargaris cristalligena]